MTDTAIDNPPCIPTTTPAPAKAITNLHLGFLTIIEDSSGVYGGYLVTNSWGRPLEFRLSSAVSPNKVQNILYGPTLDEYLHAELIGKTLIEKTATQPTLIITDSLHALAIRDRLDIPTLALRFAHADPQSHVIPLVHPRSSAMLLLSSKYESDRARIEAMLDRVDSAVDLAEPFSRIREASSEARKTGVLQRAA